MNGIETTNQPMLRLVTLLEVAAVVLSVLIATWVVVPLSPGQRVTVIFPAFFTLSLIIHSHHVRGESARELGFAANEFWHATRLIVGPTAIAVLILLFVGFRAGRLTFDNTLWWKLATLPLWGFFQQYVLQGFIYRRVREVTGRGFLPVLVTAALFAIVHLPNPMLTALTFIGGFIWTSVYERAPNLYALGLSHGIVSLLVMTTLPTSLMPSFSVGYKYFFH
jgi:membrane protease YdiL (CAAX protease family)